VSIFSSARLAGMRLARGWQLLSAVALGILVAVVLTCTVPLYNTLVSDVQLQRAILADEPVGRNVEVVIHSNTVTSSARTSSDAKVTPLVHQYLANFTGATSTFYTVSEQMPLLAAGTQTFNLAQPGAPQMVTEGFNFTSAAPHMRFLQGGPPVDAPDQPQIAITAQMASDLNLAVGSTITWSQFGTHIPQITARVTGIWEPIDDNDPYWNGLSFGSDSPPQVYPVQLPVESFYAVLPALQSVGMTQHWVYYTRPEAITTANMDQVVQQLGDFRSHVSGEVVPTPPITTVGVNTALDQTIQDVEAQSALLALPLYVIVAQVVGLALLFVTAMAGLLIEGQAAEIATLKSRGASGSQLLAVYVTQGAAVAVLAVLVGPALAAGLALLLLRVFVPASVLASSGLSGGAGASSYLAAIARPQAVIAPALIGALLGVGAVALAAAQSARLDVLAFRRERGRQARVPLWRRLYLDVALALLCVVGYIELGQFGGTATRVQLNQLGQSSGQAGGSPLLLVTPALLLLAGALLVLRLFPLGAALGARVAARGRGLTALLALAQVERHPARYGRITLLLVLAVGLGLFALTFDASLQQNISDRTTYAIGTDVRVETLSPEVGTQDAAEQHRLAALPGVTQVMPAYRSQASTPPAEGSQQVDMLGIDPGSFGVVAGSVSWRADYAGQPLSALLGGMSANVHGPEAGNVQTPIWALVSQQFATQLHLRVGDRFTLAPTEQLFSSLSFVVGGVVDEFPTLYPARLPGSFVVANVNDYLAALAASASPGEATPGPNEYWLRTTSDTAQHTQLLAALGNANLNIKSVASLREALLSATANPVSAGMRGLLIVGALTAAILAVLGCVVQSGLASRQRATQFAVLRTMGMAGRQLTGMLLGEQVVVYAFGLIGGTVLGLLLVTATLPFLQFSDTTIDPSRLGVPPYAVAFNAPGIGLFYVTLLVAFAVALAIAARYASTIGLGKALRLGED
jgi:ABC-type lipoprotein release transport system permease subunit